MGTVADELHLDIEDSRSTTFERHDLHRGFEPDSTFYIQHEHQIAGKMQIDIRSDPPPDLVIEIDVTNPSLNKLPVYAAIGVPEIWRYSEATDRVSILRLENDEYHQVKASGALTPLTDEALSAMVLE